MVSRIVHGIGALICFAYAILTFWLGIETAAGTIPVNPLEGWNWPFTVQQFVTATCGFLTVVLAIVGGALLIIATED